jgi:hypothetical protein
MGSSMCGKSERNLLYPCSCEDLFGPHVKIQPSDTVLTVKTVSEEGSLPVPGYTVTCTGSGCSTRETTAASRRSALPSWRSVAKSVECYAAR